MPVNLEFLIHFTGFVKQRTRFGYVCHFTAEHNASKPRQMNVGSLHWQGKPRPAFSSDLLRHLHTYAVSCRGAQEEFCLRSPIRCVMNFLIGEFFTDLTFNCYYDRQEPAAVGIVFALDIMVYLCLIFFINSNSAGIDPSFSCCFFLDNATIFNQYQRLVYTRIASSVGDIDPSELTLSICCFISYNRIALHRTTLWRAGKQNHTNHALP